MVYCVDFGASGGMDANLRRLLPHGRVALIEPGSDHFSRLGDEVDVVRVNCAAGSATRSATLYDPQVGGASLFVRNNEIVHRYVAAKAFERPITEETVNLKSVSEILASVEFPRIDCVKIDTQGSELDILEGIALAGALGDVCSICCEAPSVPASYIGQPPLSAFFAFFEANGFELFDVMANRAFALVPARPKVHRLLGTSSRAMDMDVLFFKSQASVVARRDSSLVARMILSYCAYNYYLEAQQLIARCRDFLSEQEAGQLTRLIGDMRRKQTSRLCRILSRLPKARLIANLSRSWLGQWRPREFPHGM